MSSPNMYTFLHQHAAYCILSLKPTMSSFSPSPRFTLFSLLPAEIRLQIWEHAAFEPRTVEITCTPPSSYLPAGRWLTHSTPPTLLLVDQEARSVALAAYSILTISSSQFGLKVTKSLYFNFKSDILWLCTDLAVPWARDLLENNEQLKSKLRNLAVNEKTWKKMNQVQLTPTWAILVADVESMPTPVRCKLKALEDVRFHS